MWKTKCRWFCNLKKTRIRVFSVVSSFSLEDGEWPNVIYHQNFKQILYTPLSLTERFHWNESLTLYSQSSQLGLYYRKKLPSSLSCIAQRDSLNFSEDFIEIFTGLHEEETIWWEALLCSRLYIVQGRNLLFLWYSNRAQCRKILAGNRGLTTV